MHILFVIQLSSWSTVQHLVDLVHRHALVVPVVSVVHPVLDSQLLDQHSREPCPCGGASGSASVTGEELPALLSREPLAQSKRSTYIGSRSPPWVVLGSGTVTEDRDESRKVDGWMYTREAARCQQTCTWCSNNKTSCQFVMKSCFLT